MSRLGTLFGRREGKEEAKDRRRRATGWKRSERSPMRGIWRRRSACDWCAVWVASSHPCNMITVAVCLPLASATIAGLAGCILCAHVVMLRMVVRRAGLRVTKELWAMLAVLRRLLIPQGVTT